MPWPRLASDDRELRRGMPNARLKRPAYFETRPAYFETRLDLAVDFDDLSLVRGFLPV